MWQRIYHIILYIIAIILIIATLIFTLTRLATPLFNSHRDMFERLMTRLVHNPVSIGRVRLNWHGLEPEILLKNVSIYRVQNHAEFLHVQHFYVAVDLIHSLWSREFLPSMITVEGIKLSVHDNGHGVYSINDMDVDTQKSGSGIDLKKLQTWFLGQNSVALKNISVDFYDPHEAVYPLWIQTIVLNNDELTHKLEGLILLKNTHSSLNLVVNATGDLKNVAHLRVQGYGSIKNLNLGQWLSKNVYGGYQVSNGVTQAQAWINWQNGQWQSQIAKVKIYDLQLRSTINNQFYALKSVEGNFAWHPILKGWKITGDQIQVITPIKIWPTTQFIVQKNYFDSNKNNAALHLWVKYADLNDVRTILQGSDLLNQATSNLISHLAPSGGILHVDYNGISQQNKLLQYQLRAGFADLAIQNNENIPGFNHVYADLQADQNGGKLILNAKNSQFSMPDLFAHAIVFDTFSTELNWKHQGNGDWQLVVNPFLLSNPDVAIKARSTVTFEKNKPLPDINFEANGQLNNPVKLPLYLPVHGIGVHAESWLDQAFLAGNPITADIILKGNLSDFPFDQKQNGLFQVTANLDQLKIRFSPDWPLLENIHGKLQFIGSKMSVDVSAGKTLTSIIDRATVTIPQIKKGYPVILLVDGDMSDSNAQNLINYVDASPLKKSVGKAIDGFKLQGQAGLHLELTLPLADLDSTAVNGIIHFPENNFSIDHTLVNISHLQGDLHFTQRSLQADKLTGQFLNQPISVTMNTHHDKKQNDITEVHFDTQADVDALKKQFMPNVGLPIFGKTPITGLLSINLNPNNQDQMNLRISSLLTGLQINYPTPLGKVASDNMPFNVTANFGQHKPTQLFVNFADFLHSAWVLKENANTHQEKLFAASINFGHALAFAPSQTGIVITGTLPIFDWAMWQPYLAPTKKDSEKDQEQSGELLHEIKSLPFLMTLQINLLKLGSMSLDSALIKIERAQENWIASITTKPIVGTVTLSDHYPATPLNAHFEHIYLTPQPNSKDSHLNPMDMPVMNLQIDDLRYADFQIGKINLQTVRSPQGVIIPLLQIKEPLLIGDFHGSWENTDNGQSKTILQGTLETPNLQGLFNMWNFKSSLIANHAQIIFNGAWNDDPFNFSFKKVVGDAFLKLENGWIIDLSEATNEKLNIGRLLTLLSVQHFMFHIHDLSRQGYSFDILTANLQFKNGIVTTSNLAAKGVVADIKAAGNIDLVQKLIDMKLGLVVNATASLPIIATIASGFNPLVGVATWLADEAVHKAMASTSKYSYELKGPWTNPDVIKLGEEKPKD